MLLCRDACLDELSQGASNFHRSAVRVRRAIWWKNVKFQIIMGVLLLGLCVFAFISWRQKDNIQDAAGLGGSTASNGRAAAAKADGGDESEYETVVEEREVEVDENGNEIQPQPEAQKKETPKKPAPNKKAA